MAFQHTSRNILNHGSVLKAECRDWNGNYKASSLDLNQYIGNSNGAFAVTAAGFADSAMNITVDGTVLSARLKTATGDYEEAVFDLNLCVANKNGTLRFQKPQESVLNCASCFLLEGSVLKGLCMGYDGHHHLSSLDLNDHYANNNGNFKSGDNHFFYSSRDVSIQPSSSSLLLKAELKGNHWYSGDFWNVKTTDLATNVVVHGGRFVFEKHDGPFDRDGFWAKFFERIPFVGFVVAGIDECMGNEEHAKRALALCANSSIICVSAILGACCGGPIGGVIATGLTTPIAILVETKIAGTIKDPQLQAQFEEATIGRYLYETLLNVVTLGAAEYLGGYIAAVAGKVTAEMLGEVAERFAERVGALSKNAASSLLKKLADALHNSKLPAEWIEAEEKVRCLQL